MTETRTATPLPLSIITPVHNGAIWIGETVESVLAQEHTAEIEYIVLDDGSTDDTLSVLKPFRDRGVTVLSHPNIGEARTVNRGAELARHDLIAVVNADDPVLPGWVASMTQGFHDPALSAAYPDWRIIDAGGRALRDITTEAFVYGVLFAQHLCIPGPGAVLRRSHLPRGELLRDPACGTSSDYDLWLRLGLHGCIRRVPQVLATWRRHPAGASSTRRGPTMAQDKISTVRSFLARSDLPPEVRALGRQALSAAYLAAALLGLRASGVPAWRYALISYWHKPFWPRGIVWQQRRSLPHLAYAAAQPLAGWLHRLVSPALPARFSRAAVLAEDFGSSHAT